MPVFRALPDKRSTAPAQENVLGRVISLARRNGDSL